MIRKRLPFFLIKFLHKLWICLPNASGGNSLCRVSGRQSIDQQLIIHPSCYKTKMTKVWSNGGGKFSGHFHQGLIISQTDKVFIMSLGEALAPAELQPRFKNFNITTAQALQIGILVGDNDSTYWNGLDHELFKQSFQPDTVQAQKRPHVVKQS